MKQHSLRTLTPFLFAALLLAALLPVRLWQQFYLVESAGGFWADPRNPTVYALYAGLGLLLLFALGAAFFLRGRVQPDLGRRLRLFEGIAAALVAVALVVDGYEACRFAVQLFKNYAVHNFEPDYESLAGRQFQYFVRSGSIAALAETAFGVLGAVFFANLFLVDCFPQKNVYLNRLTALAPLLWAVCRLLRRFSRTISYLRISDLFLDLLMLTALVVFFLAFAQVVSGINHQGKAPRLLAAGVPAAVLCLLTFIPRVAAYVFGHAEPPRDALVELCSPALALFVAAFLLGRIAPAAPPQQEEDIPEEVPEEAPEETPPAPAEQPPAGEPEEPQEPQEA